MSKKRFKRGDWICFRNSPETIYQVKYKADYVNDFFLSRSSEFHVCKDLKTKRTVEIYDTQDPVLVTEDKLIEILANNIEIKYKYKDLVLYKTDHGVDFYDWFSLTFDELYYLYEIIPQMLNLKEEDE